MTRSHLRTACARENSRCEGPEMEMKLGYSFKEQKEGQGVWSVEGEEGDTGEGGRG